tara:strand:+ start:47 stop:802 length:756 start_codon:yes stop_codon:yes gene_type:complete
MKVIQSEINKTNLSIIIIYICSTTLTIVSFIIDYNIDDIDKNCILPESNLEILKTKYDVNITQINNCEIYTNCYIEKTNETFITPYGSEKPKYNITVTTMFLPNTYYVNDHFTDSCPFAWQLPYYSYNKNMYNNCDDIGYGCCEVPLNIRCDSILHTHRNNIDFASYLYNNINNNQKKYLDIAKNDNNGSNCPTYEDLICEKFQSDYYNIIIILLTIEIWLLNITICYKCFTKKNILYQKVEYSEFVNGSV